MKKMSFENPVFEKKNQSKYIDAQWYDRFEFIGGFQPFTYFNDPSHDRELQKNLFLNKKQRNPHLSYPQINAQELDYREQELLNLKSDILSQESNDVIQQMYRWKINEKIAELRMMRASIEGNDHRFSKYSSFVYGNPEKNIHRYTTWRIRVKLEEILTDESVSSLQKNSAKKLYDLFSELQGSSVPLYQKHDPIRFINSEEKYDASQIKRSFENALTSKNISDWEVLVDHNIKSISVLHDDKTIRIPHQKKLTHTKLEGLIQHEIFTHVHRRENGDRTKIHLLGLGLDRYTKGDEGLAMYNESQISGGTDYAGFAGHFAASLAKGVDGGKRDFRDVFEILILYHQAHGKDEARASDLAWNQCLRIFRGTTGQTAGACFTKDIAYREGNIGIHTMINRNDPERARFMIGRYDPTNPRHLWILDQLNITENDLNNLEK